jgi:hypothetical protein
MIIRTFVFQICIEIFLNLLQKTHIGWKTCHVVLYFSSMKRLFLLLYIFECLPYVCLLKYYISNVDMWVETKKRLYIYIGLSNKRIELRKKYFMVMLNKLNSFLLRNNLIPKILDHKSGLFYRNRALCLLIFTIGFFRWTIYIIVHLFLSSLSFSRPPVCLRSS